MIRIILILLLPIFCLGQTPRAEEVRPNNAPRREKHKNQFDELKRRQGLWKYYNINRQLYKEVEFVNNLKEGVTRTFYPGGEVVKEEIEYLANQKDGAYTKNFFSGEPAIEGTYLNNRKHDVWRWYYENGELKLEGAYKLNKKDGTWKYYNRKGELVRTSNFINGSQVQEGVASGGGGSDKDDKKKGAAVATDAKKKGTDVKVTVTKKSEEAEINIETKEKESPKDTTE